MPSADFYMHLMNTYDGFVEEGRRKRSAPCTHATAFIEWTDDRFGHLGITSSAAELNQVRLELLDKYFDWLQIVPMLHRTTVPTEDAHVCILEVFQASYFYLTDLGLRSKFHESVPPPSPVRKPISAMILKARGDNIEVDGGT